MILYHGTWEGNEDDIINDGLIKCNASSYYSSDTKFINSLFEENLGYDLRGSCIYLTNDKDVSEGFDYAFEISTEKLNENLLYVGSNNIAQDIYYEANTEFPNEDKIKDLINEYEKTFKSFTEYKKKEEGINHNLEFLYFGDIEVTEADFISRRIIVEMLVKK